MPYSNGWRTRASQGVMLGLGLILGWLVWGRTEPKLIAVPVANQSADGATLVSGPISFQYNERTKVQVNQDALYFLDYRAGKLFAAIPEQRSTVNTSTLINAFVERDLVADFKIDPNAGSSPQFLMTTGGLGAFGEGSAPLYIFETTTRQVAIYKLSQQTIGAISRPKFDLVEVKSILALARPSTNSPAGLFPGLPELPR